MKLGAYEACSQGDKKARREEGQDPVKPSFSGKSMVRLLSC